MTLKQVLIMMIAIAAIFSSIAINSHAQRTEYLLDQLSSVDHTVRMDAIKDLIKVGETSLPRLKQILEEGNDTARESCIHVLAGLNPTAFPKVISILSIPAKDRESSIQNFAIRTLENIGAATLIVPAISDPDPTVRGNLIFALGEISVDTSEVVGAIVQALEDPSREVQIEAIEALGKKGEAATIYLPVLSTLVSRFLFSIDTSIAQFFDQGNGLSLFEVELKTIEDWTKDPIPKLPTELKRQFRLQNMYVSSRVIVSILKANQIWQIDDNSNQQIYELERVGLTIHARRSSIANEIISIFGLSGVYLTKFARITIVEKGKYWVLTNQNKVYTIKQKANRIDVFEEHSDERIRAKTVDATASILTANFESGSIESETAAELFAYFEAKLGDPSSYVNRSAARGFSKLGQNGIDYLISALDSPVSRVRFHAAAALGEIGAYQAISKLIELIGIDNENTAIFVKALGQILDARPPISDVETRSVIDAIMSMFNSDDAVIRATAAEALGKAEILPEDITLSLIQFLSGDSSFPVRKAVALSLGKAGNPRGLVISQLTIIILSDEDLRSTAIDGIGEIGIIAEQSIPTLRTTSNDDDERVRASAVLALAKVAPNQDSIDLLRQKLQDEDSKEVRVSATNALGLIATSSDQISENLKREVANVLIGAFEDASPIVQKSAVDALALIGYSRPIFDQIDLPNDNIRKNGVLALARIADPIDETADKIFELSIDTMTPYHTATIEGFREMGVVGLRQILDRKTSEDAEERRHLYYMIGKIREPGTNLIINTLVEALSDPVFEVATEAETALRNFRIPKASEALMQAKIDVWKQRKANRTEQ